MKIREAGQSSGSFAASRRPRIVKPQNCLKLSRICQDKEGPHAFVAGCGRWTESFEAANLRCVQSTRFGLRIGSYIGRTGPDHGGFRGSGGNSGAGTRFESHLGHVFSLFRGLWAAERVQIFSGPLRGPIFVGGRCGLATPSLGVDSGLAVYSFMDWGAGNCMTCCDLGSLGPPVLLLVSDLVGLVPIRVPELW